jgi:Phage tail tube protein
MKLTGRAFIDASGMGRLRSESGAELNFGGYPREGVQSDIGPVGYQEGDFAYPMISGTILHAADTDVDALNNATNITVTFTTDTGKSWVLQNAWRKDVLALDSKGKLKFVLEGMRVDKVS